MTISQTKPLNSRNMPPAGRPPQNPPANPETYQAFRNALQKSPFPSWRQWAAASGISYRMFQNYANGDNLPPMDKAATIAKVGKTTLDKLFGHLAETEKK